ncbi:MAG: hypothetical protein IPP14_15680 [Planctomycetes bacterium]|nr:hypothetical protein [Planctomycetota bacterium]
MADQNPPVQWGEDPTEGEEPEGGGDFVGPPGWANDLTLLQMMQALWRFYRPNMLHRGLNADLLDGKHLQSIYDELVTLYHPPALAGLTRLPL